MQDKWQFCTRYYDTEANYTIQLVFNVICVNAIENTAGPRVLAYR